MNDTTQAQALTPEQYAELEKKFPDDMLVRRHREITEFLDAESKAQAAHIAPRVADQVAIAQEMHRRLLARNPNWRPGVPANSKTEHGTFFLKTDNSLKMADREAFYAFLVEPLARVAADARSAGVLAPVLEALSNRLRQFLTAHVAKEGVESYVETIREYRTQNGGALPPGATGELPPGITQEQFTKVQVRKS